MLASARRIVVLTGAGISAESGVPTFRGAGGLWKEFRPEQLATPEAFAADPQLVWEWYRWRRKLVSDCRPNAAHYALARLALERGGMRIVTQNVDELHTTAARELAGAGDPAPAIPLELHGSIFRSRCTRCGTRASGQPASSESQLPVCEACGGSLRPDVVWFGEMLDSAILDEAMDHARQADICLVIGTSAVVHPAAGLASMTAAHGGSIIEVNPERTPLTGAADISIRATAAATIPAITGAAS
ncbi:MAG TPA: NAD-dependent deacylase [Gemmatimonadaceae bacterium]|nr:NAD-dependent deacylase [Gemmatimonadaceae bacterium]